MKEELLHYVWKSKNFDFLGLKTTENQDIELKNYGYYNVNAGPDFLQGRIQIHDKEWIGHIEMHVSSSDWNRHKHSGDPAYENVILHVVWEEDVIIYRNDGTRIPCLELKGRISKDLIEGYSILVSRSFQIPCSDNLRTDEQYRFYFQLPRIFIERLEDKCYPISLELESSNNDWRQVLFICFARAIGLHVNMDGMEAMARTIPVNLIAKHRASRFQLEALFFGQAGLLIPTWEDEYPKRLREEYNFLKAKYGLQEITGRQWKLSRMRPSSFPTIRIAQLAGLFHKHPDFLNQLILVEDIESLNSLLEIEASEYWKAHFLFDRASEKQIKKIGDQTKKTIIINGLVPFLFAYGQYHSKDDWIERAINIMEEISAESNKITKQWKELNIRPKNALESQALIQLYKNYCNKKRCLECSYGNHLLQQISNRSYVREPLIWV